MSRRMAIPPVMKAAAISRFGPPSVITVRERAVPSPGPHEVLLRVDTAGVGSWDPSIRDGSWRRPGRTKFPLVLGTEGAGTVVAKGSQVKGLPIGTRVYAFEIGNPKGGFYAEFVAVDERRAAPVPRHLDLDQAGAGTVTALTALQGIDRALHVDRAETVLVFGASGTVGTLAVQFAKRRKARVIAIASGQRAARLIRRLGADSIVDARKDDAPDRLRDLAPDGIDAVLALAGGDELERCLDFVRDRGRIAYPNGIEPEPQPRRGFRIRGYDAEASPRRFAELARAIAQSHLRVPIAATYPLARAAAAHRRLDDHVLGRIALRIRRR